MNIHAQFTGDVAETIEEIIRRGRAASKTAAIRLALLEYRQRHFSKQGISMRNHGAWKK